MVEREWAEVQKKIELEYQKKLKAVNDEAVQKLKHYEREHKDLLEKSAYIYSSSRKRA